jgi:GTPase SAR1 family protein
VRRIGNPAFNYTGHLTENDALLYVERSEDNEVTACVRKGKYVAFIGARQTGKTSLLYRLRRQLSDEGCIPIYIDLSSFGGVVQSRWYEHLRGEMQVQIERVLPSISILPMCDHLDFRQALRGLPRAFPPSSKIVMLLDEVSTVPESFSDLFFSAIRAVFSTKDVHPEFERYVFVLAGTFIPDEIVKNKNNSPFNVAEHIHTSDANQDGIAKLVRNLERLDLDISDEVIERIFHWTAGHLYLTQRLCAILEEQGEPQLTTQSVDSAVETMLLDDTNIRHVLKKVARLEGEIGGLAQEILEGTKVKFSRNNLDIARLELTGLIKADEDGNCVVRNRIYEKALRAMPGPSIRVDVESGLCWIKGQVVDPPLTGNLWELLTFLWENAGKVCEDEDIIEHIWSERNLYYLPNLHALVRLLRQRIKACDADNEYIVRAYNKGYMLKYAQDKEPRQ